MRGYDYATFQSYVLWKIRRFRGRKFSYDIKRSIDVFETQKMT